jgi:hypothetical protein
MTSRRFAAIVALSLGGAGAAYAQAGAGFQPQVYGSQMFSDHSKEDTITGRANATRACTLVLTSDAGIEQWWLCVDAVGDRHPANAALLGCASAIGWHSQSDGRTAGLKIGACFRNSPMGETVHGG